MEAEFGFGVYLVDVLSSRAGGADEGNVDGFGGDMDDSWDFPFRFGKEAGCCCCGRCELMAEAVEMMR